MSADLHTPKHSQSLLTEFRGTLGVSLQLKFSAGGIVLTVIFIEHNCDHVACLRAEMQLYNTDCRKLSNNEYVFYDIRFLILSQK
jgi:hypothetical protein